MLKSWEPWQEVLIPTVDTDYSANPLRGLRVRTAGNLVIKTPRTATPVTFAVAADELVPALITWIDSTSTAGGFESGR